MEAYDEAGQPVIGQVGELVITQPMPSMPVGFWNDPGGARYRESYFDTYPGVWRHGDWIELLPDGGCVIYGRSDATLNRGGVRMGTSEFYRVVEGFGEIGDSLVVDTGRLGAEGRLILYVVPAAGGELDDDLAGRLRAALRSQLSPRHVPDEIHQVPGIPRTLSGKKLEVPVRKILLGTEPERAADPNALANPEVLAYFSGTGRSAALPAPGPHGYFKRTTTSQRGGRVAERSTELQGQHTTHEGVDDAGQQRRRGQGSPAGQGGRGLDGRPGRWTLPPMAAGAATATATPSCATCAPTITGSPPRTWPRPRGWRRWPRPTPGSACAGRRAGPWSRSASRGTRSWTRAPRRAWWWTSSPTTCRTWSTRSPPG